MKQLVSMEGSSRLAVSRALFFLVQAALLLLLTNGSCTSTRVEQLRYTGVGKKPSRISASWAKVVVVCCCCFC